MTERTPAIQSGASARDLADEGRLLERVSHWLLDRLELSAAPKRLLIVPEGFLANLPWWALRTSGKPLVDQYDITLSPSIRHHLHCRNRTCSSQNVRVFVGDTAGLSTAEQEVNAVMSGFGSYSAHCYAPCKRSDWPDRDESFIWHFVGHAQLRADNPFYSSLMLDDGPLFAADFRLKRCSVGLVTLAACRTGQHSGRAGEENGGLVRALLEMGARSVVASHWAVSDIAVGQWSTELYSELRRGVSSTAAARKASLQVRETFPSAYYWGAFSVFGA